MSTEIKGRRLWCDTNYCGNNLRGYYVQESFWSRFPKDLRNVRRILLQFGDPQTPRTMKNRITFTDHNFISEDPRIVTWDLYYIKIQTNGAARLVLIPRGMFGEMNSIRNDAFRLGWKYVGAIAPWTFRWDMLLILERFFNTCRVPHCIIDAFLPSLSTSLKVKTPRQKRDDKLLNTCQRAGQETQTDQSRSNATETNEGKVSRRAKYRQEKGHGVLSNRSNKR